MDFKFSRIGQGLGSKEMWKTLGWTMLGAAGGEVLGAVAQGISGKDGQGGYKLDLSGIKGDIVTGGIVAAVGLGFNKPQVAIGTLAVKGMKAVYLYGNPVLAKTVGSPIPPSTKNDYVRLGTASEIQELPAASVNDFSAPAGMELITDPVTNKQILVSSGVAGETVNDYSNVPLADYSNEPLKDYSNVPLADYTTAPFHAQTLSDDPEAILLALAN